MKKFFASLFGIFFALQFFGMQISMADFSGTQESLSEHLCHENISPENFGAIDPKIPEKMDCCDTEITISSSSTSSAPEKKIYPEKNHLKTFLAKFSRISLYKIQKILEEKHNSPPLEKGEEDLFLVQKKITVLRI